jgi:serine/threonine protein kinase
VYRGTLDGEEVAVKVLQLEDEDEADANGGPRAAIQREVATLKGCDHPNVVRFFGEVSYRSGRERAGQQGDCGSEHTAIVEDAAYLRDGSESESEDDDEDDGAAEDHRSILADFGLHAPASVWVVMDLALGSMGDVMVSLEQCLMQRQAAFVLHSLLKGLSYVHARDIVHRDIKCENALIFNTQGEVVVKLCEYVSRRDCSLWLSSNAHPHSPTLTHFFL